MNYVELYLYDTNFILRAVIDVYKSLTWTERYTECGSFELEVDYTLENIEKFKQDYYLYNPMSRYWMIVEGIKSKTNVDSLNTIIISGRSLESILERRVVYDKIDISKQKRMNLLDAIERILNENVIEPKDETRKIPNFVYVKSTDRRISSLKLNGNYQGQDIYSIMKDICAANDFGMRMDKASNGKFVFYLYMGTDRSNVQTAYPYVTFSSEYNNLKSTEFVNSTAKYKTVVLVGSGGAKKPVQTGQEDEELNKRIKMVAQPEGPGEGLFRREFFVEAKEIQEPRETEQEIEEVKQSYDEQMKQRGLEILGEHKIEKMYSAEIDANLGSNIYGVDFFVGDIIQIINHFGVKARARITEMVISIDASGIKWTPTLTEIKANKEFHIEWTTTTNESFDRVFNSEEEAKLFIKAHKTEFEYIKAYSPISQLEAPFGMFSDLPNVTEIDISNLGLVAAHDCSDMFANCPKLKTINTGGLRTSSITTMARMFENCTSLVTLDLTGFTPAHVTSFENTFKNCVRLTEIKIKDFKGMETIKMEGMFENCSSLSRIDIPYINPKACHEYARLCYGCKSLTYLDISGLLIRDVDNITNIAFGCTSLKEAYGRDYTSVSLLNATVHPDNVVFMEKPAVVSISIVYTDARQEQQSFNTPGSFLDWFNKNKTGAKDIKLSCNAKGTIHDWTDLFKDIITLETVDLSEFNNSDEIIYMPRVFMNCSSLKHIEWGLFHPINCRNMSEMFSGCSSLTDIQLSNLAVANCVGYYAMFRKCINITKIDLSSWVIDAKFDESIDICFMFDRCTKLNKLLMYRWKIASNAYTDSFVGDCDSLTTVEAANDPMTLDVLNKSPYKPEQVQFVGYY